MSAKGPTMNEYLKTKVLTASPEELQLMLYDGAIRFCEQARVAVKNKEIENSYNLIVRAENILLELTNSMKDEIAPETCSNMRRLYIYCYEQLIEANIKKEIEPLDNTLKVLRHLRETWILLMEKLIEERSGDSDTSNAMSQMQAENPPEIDDLLNHQVGATLNVEG
jgi:flagellar secretion chaperone FliS